MTREGGRRSPVWADERGTRARLQGRPRVVRIVVESTDLAYFHDPTECGCLDRAGARRGFIEG